MKFLPGKRAEGMSLFKEMMTIMKKHGISFPPARVLTPYFGGGNTIHTIILEVEMDSLSALAEFYEKTSAIPELMNTMPKWEPVEESHILEVYGVMPEEQVKQILG
jgi:hypothetical protein